MHVNTPLEECEKRDVKGLYKKARAGIIKGFTGIDQVYETPDSPELSLDTEGRSVDETVLEVIQMLENAVREISLLLHLMYLREIKGCIYYLVMCMR